MPEMPMPAPVKRVPRKAKAPGEPRTKPSTRFRKARASTAMGI